MAVAGLSFEELELELSSPSLLLLLFFLAAFWFFSPVLLDFSLLVLFLPAIWRLDSGRICTGECYMYRSRVFSRTYDHMKCKICMICERWHD